MEIAGRRFFSIYQLLNFHLKEYGYGKCLGSGELEMCEIKSITVKLTGVKDNIINRRALLSSHLMELVPRVHQQKR